MTRRESVNEALLKRKLKEEHIRDKQLQVNKLIDNITLNLKRQEIARKAAKMVQDGLGEKLSGIVTRALVAIFEEDIEFVVSFVERRGVSECDLSVRIGDYMYDPLKGQGGGVADICSICLQMAFLLMSGAPRILFIDEPARHTDVVTQERLGLILQQLCLELDFTIVMVTHSQLLASCAVKEFRVVQKNGISSVYEKDRNK